MKLTLIAILVLVAVSVGAQSANVIVLAPEDAAKAKLVYDRLEQAKSDWESERTEIKAKYGRKGFEEFEFSKDFRAIVPSTTSSTFLYNSTGTSTITLPYYGQCWTTH